jgi:NarL family two-component system sensor histidine kinase YdfH
MDDKLNRKEKFIGFSFYIFLMIVILGIYGLTTPQETWQAGISFSKLLTVTLIGIHIGFYWLNLWLSKTPRWWVFYYSAQTLLIIALAFMPNGVHVLATLIIAIIVETVGVMGNTRRALAAGLFYILLMIVLFWVLLDHSVLLKYVTQVMINGGFVILLMVIFNLQVEQRFKAEELAESLESANAKLAAYAARNEALTLQAERERLARELHDTLAQGVAGVILQLEAIKAHQGQQNYTQAQSVLDQAINHARSTLSESRAAIEDLRNNETDFADTVRALVNYFQASGSSKYSLSLKLTETTLTSHIQHHARRILHEALSNITRHAAASEASVEITQSATHLHLQISDNGVGFDTSQPSPPGHFGLQGLAERARLTSSRYQLDSQIGKGTTISFQIPLGGGKT